MKFTCSSVNVMFGNNHAREGFSQKERFVLKRNAETYDDFYVDLYDELHVPSKRAKSETMQIIQMTQPSKEYSVFLDIGSGTGHLMNELQNEGYNVFGIDKSSSMVKTCEKTFPNTKSTVGDIMDPMAFEQYTFTHILCLYFTIYEIEDKTTFFRHCYSWIKSGGYLFLHLVNPEQFNSIIPGGRPWFVKHKTIPSEISNTEIDFVDFKYNGAYQNRKENEVTLVETFTDSKTGNVRQNERNLHMESIESILEKAKMCGFILHGQVNYQYPEDPSQYLIILERSN